MEKSIIETKVGCELSKKIKFMLQRPKLYAYVVIFNARYYGPAHCEGINSIQCEN